jgi:phosphonate transport system substrate-binding protein
MVNAATNNSESLERIERTKPEKRKNIRVIWTSPLIPSDPLAWRKDLDAGIKKKITDWMFSYGKTDAEKKILSGLQWSGLKKSDNNQLLPIRQMAINKDIMKVKGNDKLSADDKKAKIAELEAKAAEIAKQIEALGKK